ncbi:TPA: lanthionine synthetase LanC family protein, partial [Streptococcus pneumoniae]
YGDVANLFDNVMMKDEVCQLRKGDIPIFYANTSSNEIYNGLGRYICALDGHSIANKVLNRITSLSDDNLLRQKRIINMAFMGSELFSKKFRVSEEHMNTETITSKIINRISSAKFEFNNETSWLAMVAMNKSYEIYPMDCSLYSGTSGMILGITSIDDTRLRTLLPGVINYTNNYIKELQGNFPIHQLGAFTGVYGYLYTLCVLREEGTPFVEDIEEIIYETLSSTFRQLRNIDNLDIIGGLAGILGVLIKIQKTMLDSSRVTELTQKLSEGVVQKILEKYKKDGFWIENDPGYAHGNYGIITQLYRYSLSNTCKFDAKTSIISCIKEYLDKERSLLCGKNGFPLRNNAKYYSWYNGIVGIVNAKNYLETNEFPDKFLKTEVQDYSIKILNQDSTLDNSICHGSIGNLVILDSILGYSVDIENRIATESSSYLLDKETYECDDWGILTGEMGILMANDRKSRTRLNDILLLN